MVPWRSSRRRLSTAARRNGPSKSGHAAQIHRRAADARRLAEGGVDGDAAERGEAHARAARRVQVRHERQGADGGLEGVERGPLARGGGLHDGAVLEVRAVEAARRVGLGAPFERRERAVGEQRLAAAGEDPAARIPTAGAAAALVGHVHEQFREVAGDVAEALARGDVVERDDGVVGLRDLLVRAAAGPLRRAVVLGLRARDEVGHHVPRLGEVHRALARAARRVHREHHVAPDARIGLPPRDLPRVLLDRLEAAALRAPDGVRRRHVRLLVDVLVANLGVAHPVAGALEFALEMRRRAVGGDGVEDGGRLVARHREDRRFAAQQERGVAEEQPRVAGAVLGPAPEQGRRVDARRRADMDAVERFGVVIRQQVIEHHVAALPHLGVCGEAREHRHRGNVEAHVAGAVVLALPARRREVDPVAQVVARLVHVFPRRFAVEPRLGPIHRVHLGDEVHGGVVHRPVVLGVAAVGHVGAPRVAQAGAGGGRKAVAPGVHDDGDRVHPEHVAAGIGEERVDAGGAPVDVGAAVEVGGDVDVATRAPVGRRHLPGEEVDERVAARVEGGEACGLVGLHVRRAPGGLRRPLRLRGGREGRSGPQHENCAGEEAPGRRESGHRAEASGVAKAAPGASGRKTRSKTRVPAMPA